MLYSNKQPVVAKNGKAVRTARESIKFLAPVVQEYHTNAIMPDGRQSLLYILKTNGRQCTCHSYDPLDVDGNMSDEQMQSILDDARTETSISGYSSFSIDIDDVDVQEDINPSEPFLAPSIGCHVCMGSNYVGGYNLHNGLRLILDVRDWEHNFVQSGAPLEIHIPKNGSIRTIITLPKGVYRVDQFEARYNDLVLHPNVYIDDTQVDADNLPTFFDGQQHTIQCVFTEEVCFTHFCIQVGFGDLKVDYSKVVNSTQNDRFTQVGNFTLVLPPIIYTNLKGAIVCDSTEGFMYRITESSRDTTFNGVILTTEAQARLVQPYELSSGLPSLGTVLKHGGYKSPKKPRRSWL